LTGFTILLLVGSLPTTQAQAHAQAQARALAQTVGNATVDQVAKEAHVFGTEGSYDSGGTDPLCFASKYNITDDDSNDSNETSTTISELNDLLFEDSETSATLQLMKNCFPGTNFSLTPLNAPSDRELLAGTTYTFRLELETMLSPINQVLVKEIDEGEDGSIQIWFRLLFCNAFQVGFCSPLLDTREFVDDLEASQTDQVPDDTPDDPNDYQQGNALKAIDKDGSYIASRWVSWKLQPQDLDGDVYNATVDISLILPQDAGGVYFFLGTYPIVS
jgi:hypothetical protein